MKPTAEIMAKGGCTMPMMLKPDGSSWGDQKFETEDAHQLFTSRWPGVDGDGTQLSWAQNCHDGMRAATKGERFNALRQHEDWATEKGLQLFNPRGSEYDQLTKEQDR